MLSDEPDHTSDEIELTPSDRQMVRAIAAADSARIGVVVLRVLAAIVALAAIVGYGLTVLEFDRNNSTVGGTLIPDPETPDRQQWGVFLAGIATPLAFASLLVAASYILSVYASRLDMDIVLAEQDEPEEDDLAG